MSAGSPSLSSHGAWTHHRFLEALRVLSPLRVISLCGASTFEAICSFDAYGVSDGCANAITPAYHWHLELARFGHLVSGDRVHERSGRRVLFFELREHAAADPFLQIYLHRAKGEPFGEERERAFESLHAVLSGGCEIRS